MNRISTVAYMLVSMVAASGCADAQWLSYRESRTPRLKDGSPNLAAPAPRVNGKPDLSGIWRPLPETKAEWDRVLGPGALDLQIDLDRASRYAMNVLADFKQGEEPLRPGVRPPTAQAVPNLCLPDSLPFASFIEPFKIVQSREQLVFLYESKSPWRQVFLDGRPLPQDPQPSWMGYSTGKWSGDTLNVEAIGFIDAPLDAMAHPRSESARITERYHRRDFGHMDLEVTIDDAKNYTRPFTVKVPLQLVPDSDVMEFVCAENERDRNHMK